MGPGHRGNDLSGRSSGRRLLRILGRKNLIHTIFIDGEAGTTGLEIRERVEARGDLELILLGDRRRDVEARREALNSADAVILCLPDDAAKEAVGMIANPDVRVIDASTAYRVDPAWTYGFAEMAPGQREAIGGTKRVSNPGCYPTGFIGLVRPLVAAGLLPADWPVTVNAVSGYSGGGKSMIAEFEDAPGAPPYRAYGLSLKHKHVPEMTRHTGLSREVLFAPAVGTYRQGMLVEVPLQLGALPGSPSVEAVHGALTQAYAGQRFVEVAELEETEAMAGIAPEGLNGTNRMRLHVFGDRGGAQVRLVALLDNLGKGASGAAVQNLNLMLGLDEATGLV
ncbi:MAG: N-acetyl-gamma-glutamyl-phosphate reductase [Brevundimonas sp.]|nr:MAG: N-acetyl-gamma-glutamyl-phosphate reductase [Brevundimonas sp.]